mgnify:CR=1 FL=1
MYSQAATETLTATALQLTDPLALCLGIKRFVVAFVLRQARRLFTVMAPGQDLLGKHAAAPAVLGCFLGVHAGGLKHRSKLVLRRPRRRSAIASIRQTTTLLACFLAPLNGMECPFSFR